MSDHIRLREEHGYTTSRDYRRLWDLAQEQAVVCFLDYKREDGHPPIRDVSTTRLAHGVMEVGARGISYVWAEDAGDFERQCARLQLEFLPPQERTGGVKAS